MALLTDTFTRANTTADSNIAIGWGTASDGNTWSSTGDAGTFQIVSNQGKVTTSASNQTWALLSSNTYADADVTVRVSTSASSTSNWQGVFLRYQDSNNAYYAYVRGTHFSIGRDLANSHTILADTSFTQAANTEYRIRFRAVGPTLFAKVWADGSAEPVVWTLTTNDTNFTSGRVGIYIAPDVAATTAVYDNFSVSAVATKDTKGRFPLAVGTNLKNASLRFKLAGGRARDTVTRLTLSVRQWKDSASRFPLAVGTLLKNVRARFPLGSSAFKDSASRFPLAAGTLLKNLASRLKLGVSRTSTMPTRFPLSIQAWKNVGGRFPLAKAYYVSPTGSDSTGDGSVGNPWATPWYAAAHIAGGDTVLVADGTYTVTDTTGNITITASGTGETTRTVLKAINKWGAKIVNQITPTNSNLNDPAICILANYASVEGFDISGAGGRIGIYAYGKDLVGAGSPAGSYMRVKNCFVHDLGQNVNPAYSAQAIQFGQYRTTPGYNAIHNECLSNVVRNCGVPNDGASHGIYFGTAYGVIENNIVNNVPGDGIKCFHFCHHMTVSNNLTFSCGNNVGTPSGCGIFIGAGGTGWVQGTDEPDDFCVVTNNIVRDCSGYGGIYEYANGQTGAAIAQVVANNTFSNNSYYGNAGTQANPFKSDSGAANTNAGTSDPLFVTYQTDGTGDYHLLKGSPCIDAGTATGAPTTDLDGIARPGPNGLYDIGPYEGAVAIRAMQARFPLGGRIGKNIAVRLGLAIGQTRDTRARFPLAAVRPGRHTPTRFNLATLSRSYSPRALGSTLLLAFGDLATRFHLAAQAVLSTAARFALAAQKPRDGSVRFNLATQVLKIAVARLKLAAVLGRDAVGRLPLGLQQTKLLASRFPLSGVRARDTRGRLHVAVQLALTSRARLLLALLSFKSVTTRLNLGITRVRDLTSRVNLTVQQFKAVSLRLRLSALPLRDAHARFSLSQRSVQDSHTRFPLGGQRIVGIAARLVQSIRKSVDGNARFLLGVNRGRDTSIRLNLASGTALKLLAQRLNLASGTAIKVIAARLPLAISRGRDYTSRYTLSIQKRGDTASRFPVALVKVPNGATRVKVAATRTRDTASRFPLQIAGLATKLSASRFHLGSRAVRDTSARFGLATLGIKTLSSRFHLAGVLLREARSRFHLASRTVRDTLARFALGAARLKQVASRFPLAGGAAHDARSRFLMSGVRLGDTHTHFGLGISPTRATSSRLNLLRTTTRLLPGRFPQGIDQRPSWPARFPLKGVRTRDTVSRLILSLSRYQSLAGRLSLAEERRAGVLSRFKLATGTSAPTFVTVKSARGTHVVASVRGTITAKGPHGTLTAEEE